MALKNIMLSKGSQIQMNTQRVYSLKVDRVMRLDLLRGQRLHRYVQHLSVECVVICHLLGFIQSSEEKEIFNILFYVICVLNQKLLVTNSASPRVHHLGSSSTMVLLGFYVGFIT